MKPVLITHLGLGDAIVCAGLAVELSNRHNGLIFPCWKHNEVSVKSFFVNHPEILVLPIETEDDLQFLIKEKSCILTGHYSGRESLRDEGFDGWIYRTAGVDIRHRWESDPLPQAAKMVRQFQEHALTWAGRGPTVCDIYIPGPFCFYHEDEKRDFCILKLDKQRAPICPLDFESESPSILAYADCLERSESIQVINSSFFHLSESLPTTGSLHLHQYARPHARIDMPCLRKNWNIIQ